MIFFFVNPFLDSPTEIFYKPCQTTSLVHALAHPLLKTGFNVLTLRFIYVIFIYVNVSVIEAAHIYIDETEFNYLLSTETP